MGLQILTQMSKTLPRDRVASLERQAKFLQAYPSPLAAAWTIVRHGVLLCVISRRRIGLRTNKANPTTAIFITAVTANTMCQLPVAVLIILATGTRKADVPFAV